MDQGFLDWLFAEFTHRGVKIEPGLSDTEIDAVQNKYGFIFPPDLCRILQYVLPIYERGQPEIPGLSPGLPRWIDWRHGTEEVIRLHLSWPLRSICHDVERNRFWVDDWGIRPPNPIEARSIAQQRILSAPKLVPIYSHRYLAANPQSSGNPVYSIWYTDIIRYGDNLESYFKNEFIGWRSDTHYQTSAKPPRASSTTRRYIAFWDDLVRLNGGG